MISRLLFFILGVVVVFLLAFICSSDRKAIKYRSLFIIMTVQLVMCVVLLETRFGVVIMNGFASVFDFLIDKSQVGVRFVFGNIDTNENNGFVLFLNVLMPIVFISALIGILQYLKILPLVIRSVGFLLSKVSGMGKLESFNAVSSISLGQAENFLAYKNIIGHLSPNVLYTMAATAMSTVSLSILGSYMTMIDAKYVCVAIIMNMLSTFFVLHIINPYDYKKESSYEELEVDYDTDSKRAFFVVLGEYILDGFKIAVVVAAILIGFMALIATLNSVFESILGISFQNLLGYLFYPFAWVLHIPASELLFAGKVMGTKLVSNEFVAMLMVKDNMANLSLHTQAVISVFLVSFANFSSIGIVVGTIYSLSKRSGEIMGAFGLKMLFGATLVSFLSAVIVGLFI
ncbi:NupC/NupG family nucleoside CNT transporter [Francisella marina]|uniref:NupC/NupG family nucleoside CNT transporter n=1 Tax=Francisella marina TaxID=2249302 RepID=A0ABX5ZHP2_9GAMM|nr:nucleoside transporter C-terminal domain-containing protein [Francisella marina]QEO57677.1 NupC/NupG family nucleoside CNT transporter [Francisella marina]QEO60096.1 NupC/NupG family nucleoside CNT transporter [Francisella marina]